MIFEFITNYISNDLVKNTKLKTFTIHQTLIVILDFIIIGQGIAGSCLAHLLLKAKKDVLVIDKPSANNCSSVAAGIINPITGMRLTKTWLAEEIFPYSQDFYKSIESQSNKTFWHTRAIVRPANDVEQLNDALSRINDGFLGNYIEYTEKDKSLDQDLKANHGYYKINSGGYLDVNGFVEYTRDYLKESDSYRQDWINEEDIVKEENHFEIKEIKAKHVIICTGHYQNQSLNFKYLPFAPTVGEMIKLKIESLDPNYLYSKNSFLLSKKKDEFIAGATFGRDININLTEKGRLALKEKMSDLLKSKFNIIDHYYGIRPTVLDRKPFVGEHPQIKNLFILNGLGAKGVTQGPYFANELVNFIINNKKIHSEANIKRCEKKYFN